jgi:hypothetical protein
LARSGCYDAFVITSDLATLIQRRELLAYEHKLARRAYAYGVDLRRTAWLDGSSIGQALMRGVDRGWSDLAATLGKTVLEPADVRIPGSLLDELAALGRLLRAPQPAVRLLRNDSAAREWPIVSALGTTKASVHWLVIDPRRIDQLADHERTFLLASGLANLQCDHGPLNAAHLLARDSFAAALVAVSLRPWTKVATFSADRAGMLALGSLERSIAALQRYGETPGSWAPRPPTLAVRIKALEDFDRSRAMTRMRHVRSQIEQASERPETHPGAARVESAGVSPSSTAGTSGRPAASQGDPYRDAPDEAPPDDLESRLKSAWSLARCDQRLTHRLGLL